jgi:hypothetical protein
MSRPKAPSEVLREVFDRANEKCPPDEMIKNSTSNRSQLGDLMREVDVSKLKVEYGVDY